MVEEERDINKKHCQNKISSCPGVIVIPEILSQESSLFSLETMKVRNNCSYSLISEIRAESLLGALYKLAYDLAWWALYMGSKGWRLKGPRA